MIGTTSGWTTAIRVTAVIFGSLVLFSGSASVVGSFMVRTDVKTTVFSDPVKTLRVQNDTGTVRVRTGSTGQDSSVLSRNNSSYRTAVHTETVRDGVLDVTTECRGGLFFIGDSCSVDLEIVVPPRTAVDVATSSGSVRVTGTGGPVTARSDTGNIRVHDAAGTIKLTSDTGGVSGDGLTGRTVSATTGTGDVRLTFTSAPDQVNAAADTGDIRLLLPRGGTLYRVLADSDSNEARIDVPTSSASERVISARTGTGTITIGQG